MKSSVELKASSAETIPAVDVHNYKLLDHGEVATHDLYSHPLVRVIDPFTHTIWFRKLMENYQVALHEVLARNLLHFYDPHQPETILAWHPKGASFVMSREVPNFRDLPTKEETRFEKNEYPGLGRSVILSIIFYNTDLKNGNIGLGYDEKLRRDVVKIVDGDWFFAPFRDPEWYEDKPNVITSALLDNLPFPFNFYAYHWLDYIKSENISIDSNIVSRRLADFASFRLEINQIILKCLLTPLSYLNSFVEALIPVTMDPEKYIEFLHTRFRQLRESALENDSFQAYLLTRDARITSLEFATYLENYSIQNRYVIIENNERPHFKQQFTALYNELLSGNILVSPLSLFQSESSQRSLALSTDSQSSVFSDLDALEEEEKETMSNLSDEESLSI